MTLTQDFLIRPIKKKKNKTNPIYNQKKKSKKLEGPVQGGSREGPKKQSYLKFLTNKMAQIFIILYLIPDTTR